MRTDYTKQGHGDCVDLAEPKRQPTADSTSQKQPQTPVRPATPVVTKAHSIHRTNTNNTPHINHKLVNNAGSKITTLSDMNAKQSVTQNH